MWTRCSPLARVKCRYVTPALSPDEDELFSPMGGTSCGGFDDTLHIFPNLAVLEKGQGSSTFTINLLESNAQVEIPALLVQAGIESMTLTTTDNSNNDGATTTNIIQFKSNEDLMMCYCLLTVSKARVTLKDFQPVHTIGKGKFGKVIVATRKRASGEKRVQTLAVKEIECQTVNNVKIVLRERIVMERITLSPSPFTTQLKFAMLVGNRAYFMMDLQRGGDLFMVLRNNELSYNGARFYATEVLVALQYLHSLGIIYRDLKPENILVDDFGHVKIADFGLSRIMDDASELATTCCGTAAYTPPEMLTQTGYGHSVDYWQYGCFVYELFMGQSPFYLPNAPSSEAKRRILAAEYEFPEPCSRRWRRLVASLLVPDVGARLGRGGLDGWAAGWDAVAQEPFFSQVDWNCVRARRYEPPVAVAAAEPAGETGAEEEEDRRYLQHFDREFLDEAAAFAPAEEEGGARLPVRDPAVLRGFDFFPHAPLHAGAARLAARLAARRRRAAEELEAAAWGGGGGRGRGRGSSSGASGSSAWGEDTGEEDRAAAWGAGGGGWAPLPLGVTPHPGESAGTCASEHLAPPERPGPRRGRSRGTQLNPLGGESSSSSSSYRHQEGGGGDEVGPPALLGAAEQVLDPQPAASSGRRSSLQRRLRGGTLSNGDCPLVVVEEEENSVSTSSLTTAAGKPLEDSSSAAPNENTTRRNRLLNFNFSLKKKKSSKKIRPAPSAELPANTARSLH